MVTVVHGLKFPKTHTSQLKLYFITDIIFTYDFTGMFYFDKSTVHYWEALTSNKIIFSTKFAIVSS